MNIRFTFFVMVHRLLYIKMFHESVADPPKPSLTVQRTQSHDIRFTCLIPGSTNEEINCHLYFGSSQILSMNIWKPQSSGRVCNFVVSIDDFVRRLQPVQHKEGSCDYRLGREPNTLSPRSDGFNLTGESGNTQVSHDTHKVLLLQR